MKKFVQKNSTSKTNFSIQSGLSRNAVASLLCLLAISLTMLGLAATSPSKSSAPNSPFAAATAGSWAIVGSANTSATQHNYLQSVTCVSATDCWAVGHYITGRLCGSELIPPAFAQTLVLAVNAQWHSALR